MNPLLDLLAGSLDSRAVDRLGDQIEAPPLQVGAAVQAALPLLLGALQRNASSASGAASLAGALERDHDGSVLDDVARFFGQSATGSEVRSLDHIFGAKRPAVESALSRASGLDTRQITQLLAQLAPLVLGALAKARQGGSRPAGSSSGGLSDLLGGAVGQLQQRQGGLAGALGGLLDADGDGSVVDDLLGKVAGGGSGGAGGLGGLLGGLLGGGKRG